MTVKVCNCVGEGHLYTCKFYIPENDRQTGQYIGGPVNIGTSYIGETSVKTDKLEYDLTQIPYLSLVKIGRVFREGEVKYGKDNWKGGRDNKEYQLERANHALRHLLVYIHWLDTEEYLGEVKNGKQELDLAKVAWFCLTQLEIERLEHG